MIKHFKAGFIADCIAEVIDHYKNNLDKSTLEDQTKLSIYQRTAKSGKFELVNIVPIKRKPKKKS
jgi:hypothetical protein